MRKLFLPTCLAACICFAASSLQAQTPVQQNTVKGGVAGAIIGGIIGHQNDETAEGVAIGAALGALTGNVVGKSQQQNALRQQQYQAQLYEQEQLQLQANQVRLDRAVSLSDAVAMTNSGMSDDLIISQIINNGVQQQIGVSEVITLHQNGVREPVIKAMQNAPIGQAAIQPSPQYEQVVAAPVITHVAGPVVAPVVIRPNPAPRVIVHSTPVYRRPTPSPSYYRGRPQTRYPSNSNKYRNSGRSSSGASIRIGF